MPRQAAAVDVLLRFFRLCILAFEVSQRHVQRFVTEADANGVHRDAFFVQGVGIALVEAVKFGAFDASFLSGRGKLRAAHCAGVGAGTDAVQETIQ